MADHCAKSSLAVNGHSWSEQRFTDHELFTPRPIFSHPITMKEEILTTRMCHRRKCQPKVKTVVTLVYFEKWFRPFKYSFIPVHSIRVYTHKPTIYEYDYRRKNHTFHKSSYTFKQLNVYTQSALLYSPSLSKRICITFKSHALFSISEPWPYLLLQLTAQLSRRSHNSVGKKHVKARSISDDHEYKVYYRKKISKFTTPID